MEQDDSYNIEIEERLAAGKHALEQFLIAGEYKCGPLARWCLLRELLDRYTAFVARLDIGRPREDVAAVVRTLFKHKGVRFAYGTKEWPLDSGREASGEFALGIELTTPKRMVGDEGVLFTRVARTLRDHRLREVLSENAQLKASLAQIKARLGQLASAERIFAWLADSEEKDGIAAEFPEETTALQAEIKAEQASREADQLADPDELYDEYSRGRDEGERRGIYLSRAAIYRLLTLDPDTRKVQEEDGEDS